MIAAAVVLVLLLVYAAALAWRSRVRVHASRLLRWHPTRQHRRHLQMQHCRGQHDAAYAAGHGRDLPRRVRRAAVKKLRRDYVGQMREATRS